jgi:hypothetical protein
MGFLFPKRVKDSRANWWRAIPSPRKWAAQMSKSKSLSRCSPSSENDDGLGEIGGVGIEFAPERTRREMC